MDEALQVKLLGGFSVRVNGVLIPDEQWHSKRVRSLVKLLALAPGQRLQRDQVLDTLWPDSDFSAAVNNLHQTLFNARKIFDAAGATCLVLEDGLVSLGNGLSVDVEQFEVAAAGAKKSQDPALFQVALGLYSGDLLPEDLYEEWAVQRRETLRRLRLKLLLDLAGLLEACGETDEAVRNLDQVVALDRAHEEAHTRLMRLFARSGRRQQALRQFQLLRDGLRGELEIEPGPESSRLYAEIQSGQFQAGPAAPAAAAKYADPPPRRHNLPAQLTSFIGRENEITELRPKVTGQRQVTLTGAGGTGKTRLALQVAESLLETFADGVFYVELAPLSDPALVPQACIQALELTQQPGVSPETILVHFLESKHLLLILDNCEHILAACIRLASTLLKECPRLHILATSREILSIPGEAAFRVPSLAFPDPHSQPELVELGQFEAVRLFVARSEQAMPGFGLTAANAGSVAQICRRLDGIPLALELAAARMRLMTVGQLASRLDDTFRLLTGGSKAVLPRQQTLKSTIDWSYNLLSTKERLLLHRLSVFAGGWTLEAAEAVCADEEDAENTLVTQEVLDVLTQLVDKSLVAVAIRPDGARYHLLETIRQYARDRLMENGGGADVRRRHLVYFSRLSGEAEPHLRGKDQVEWLERLDEELDNLRAALEWSFSDRIELGLKIAADLMWFWHARGLFIEETGWLDKLLLAEAQDRGEQPLAGERALQRARGLRSFAHHDGYIHDENVAKQIAMQQDSIAILRALDPLPGRELGITLFYLLYQQEKLDQPAPIREEMLNLLHKENAKFYLSQYFLFTASLASHLDQIIDRIKTSLAISHEIEDLDGISALTLVLGYQMMLKGEYAQAEALMNESLALSRIVKNRWWEACVYVNLAHLALVQGNCVEAVERAEEALKRYRVHFRTRLDEPLGILQQTAWSQGQYDQSIRYGQEIIASFAGRSFQKLVTFSYLTRAAVSQGDLSQAEMYVKELLASDFWVERRLDWDTIAPYLLCWIALCRLQGKYLACARLIGTVDSYYRQMVSGLIPRERSEYEEDLAAARAALGEEAFAAAFGEGQAATFEQALAWMAGELQV